MITPPGGTNAADKEIADRITNALIIKKISIRTLSEEAGIKYPTLRRSLSEDRPLTVNELGRIAAVIGVPALTLMPEHFAQAA